MSEQNCSAGVTFFHAVRNGLPHSKQQALWRAVISPQNGHILCGPESLRDELFPSNFLAASAIHANNARIWTGNGFTVP